MLAPKGRAYRGGSGRRYCIVGTVLILKIAVVTLAYIWYKGSSSSSTGTSEAALLAERTQLLSSIDSWNARASKLPGQSLAALTVSTVPHDETKAVASLDTTPRTLASSTAYDPDRCDPEDPNQAYRMRPAADVAKENPELVRLLNLHAKNNEIMLTLANAIMICKNTTICWWGGGNILESFLEILQYTKVTNYLIGVMDDETEEYLAKKQPPVNWFRVNVKIPDIQKGSHPANQVSTIKYTLIKTFLQLRYNVLITDMDLVYFSNPFDHLHRDADIEVQTDGFDEVAYGVVDGISDKTMGWGGGGLFIRTFTVNVGCMWVKANARSFKLMQQVSESLSQTPGWDQQVFNQYLMRPSHGDVQYSYAHLRVMDIDKWLNSKIFFRSRRSQYLPGATASRPTPVLVHMNYHPDKHKRMLCLMDRYFHGKVSACDGFPGGSNPGT